MAEAESITVQTIKKIDSKLECSICLEPYKEPKLLPCFHVFCKSPCLEKLVKSNRQGNSYLQCPNCRHLVTLSESGVAGLQSDFHMDHLIEIRELLDKAHHKKQLKRDKQVKETNLPQVAKQPEDGATMTPITTEQENVGPIQRVDQLNAGKGTADIPNSVKSFVTFNEHKPFLADMQATINLWVMTNTNNPYVQQVTLTGHLVHLKSGKTAAVEVTHRQSNKYDLSFTPYLKGDSELRINISGQPFKAFPLSVAPHPTCLEKPTRVIGGLNRSWSTAINNKGHIMVTDIVNHQILIIRKDGLRWESNVFGTKGMGGGYFNEPHGVAIDCKDNIYVADYNNYCVQKFSPEGQFQSSVGTYGRGKLQFYRPEGLAYNKTNDMLYVSEDGNNRIQILTSDLGFCSTFGSKGNRNGEFQHPVGVCCDDKGSVFVADWGNNRVQVFTARGEFVRMMGKGILYRPQGVAVSAGVLYVVESEGHRHSFTLNDELIGSFSQRWRSRPAGIAVNKDQSVVIADANCNMLQCF